MVFKIRSIFGSGEGKDDEHKELNQEQDLVVSSSQEEVSGVDQNSSTVIDDISLEQPDVSKQESIVAKKKNIEELTAAEPIVNVAPEEVSQAVQAEEQQLEAEKEPEKKRPPRRKPRSHDELFFEAIPERANNASSYLKGILTGKIVIEVLPSGRKYLINWPINEECTVSDYASIAEPQPAADCTISLHGKDLLRISDGDLNPQVLMLSHKAKITGSPKLATYVFNLIAPTQNI